MSNLNILKYICSCDYLISLVNEKIKIDENSDYNIELDKLRKYKELILFDQNGFISVDIF